MEHVVPLQQRRLWMQVLKTSMMWRTALKERHFHTLRPTTTINFIASLPGETSSMVLIIDATTDGSGGGSPGIMKSIPNVFTRRILPLRRKNRRAYMNDLPPSGCIGIFPALRLPCINIETGSCEDAALGYTWKGLLSGSTISGTPVK